MLTSIHAEWLVSLWMLPMVLFIVLPLTILVVSGFIQLVKKAGEKSRALQQRGVEEQSPAQELLQHQAAIS